MIVELKNTNAPELDVFARLTEAQLKNKRNPAQGIFIAESPKVIGYALNKGCEPLALLMERKHMEGDAKELIARCGDIPVYTGEREVLASLTGYELHGGFSAPCVVRRCPLRRRCAATPNGWPFWRESWIRPTWGRFFVLLPLWEWMLFC